MSPVTGRRPAELSCHDVSDVSGVTRKPGHDGDDGDEEERPRPRDDVTDILLRVYQRIRKARRSLEERERRSCNASDRRGGCTEGSRRRERMTQSRRFDL